MLNRSSPQAAGFDPEKLDVALDKVRGWVEDGVTPGVAVLVARRGRIAALRAYGHMSDYPDARPLQTGTVFAVASLTKIVTAAAFLRQVDQGKTRLDTPVCDVLAEWQVPGVQRITFQHLLSHTSGLPVDLPEDVLDYEDGNSYDVIIEAMLKVAPVKAPGEELIYSNIGYALLGRAIERLSGYSYREAVWREVLGPLWMNDSWFGSPPEGREGDVAPVAGLRKRERPLEPYNSTYFRELAMPWGGMFSTVEDLAKLAQVFLDNGKPLLEVGTALAAIRNLTNGLYGGFSTWRSFPTGDWGLGWEIKGSRGRHWTGERTSHATFGHAGASGTMFWADPMCDIVCVALANCVIGNSWPIAAPHYRWQSLSNAVIDAVSD